jgi:hypothetical protein
MRQSILVRAGLCLGTLFALSHCSDPGSNSTAGTDGAAINGANNTTSAANGATSGGTTAAAGATGSSTSGGATGTTGSTSGAGNGNTSSGTNGGQVTSGNQTSAGQTTTGGAGGSTAVSTDGGATTTGTTGSNVDANGKSNASPGDETTVSRDYLKLGELRLLNNRWGSDERGCDTQLRMFVTQDRKIGWDFNRGACGGEHTQPDFPEVEFGVHPFGIGSVNETSPPFSSTTLLPLQIKDISSAGVTVDNMVINLQNQSSWNISVEFWLSERHPVSDPNPGTHAELIAFWGWQDGRWPCDIDGNVQAGDRSYRLCHQVNDWANGQWRYFQFWMDGGPSRSFNGRVDIKAFIDWLVSAYGYSTELWVTRIEVGSEIDDNTSGTVMMDNITFEVNGNYRSVELAE